MDARAEGGPRRTRDRCADGWPCARSGVGQRRHSFGGPEPVRGTAPANQGRYTRRTANDAVTPVTTTEAEAGAPDGRTGAM